MYTGVSRETDRFGFLVLFPEKQGLKNISGKYDLGFMQHLNANRLNHFMEGCQMSCFLLANCVSFGIPLSLLSTGVILPVVRS